MGIHRLEAGIQNQYERVRVVYPKQVFGHFIATVSYLLIDRVFIVSFRKKAARLVEDICRTFLRLLTFTSSDGYPHVGDLLI